MVDGFGFLLAEGAEGGHLLSCNSVASEGISHHQEVCLDCCSGYGVGVGHVCFPSGCGLVTEQQSRLSYWSEDIKEAFFFRPFSQWAWMALRTVAFHCSLLGGSSRMEKIEGRSYFRRMV